MHDLHPKGRHDWGCWTVVVVVPDAVRLRSERISLRERWGLRRTRQPRGRQWFRNHRLRRVKKRVWIRSCVIRWAAHGGQDDNNGDERDMQPVTGRSRRQPKAGGPTSASSGIGGNLRLATVQDLPCNPLASRHFRRRLSNRARVSARTWHEELEL